MNYFGVDDIIIYIFLLITLVVGLWAGRNVKTIKEYALANRTYGSGVLAISILATYITGSKGIGFVGYTFDDGILPILSGIICGIILNFFFIARYIAPNIYHFEGNLTAAEIMGKLYGEKARFCIGVLGTFYNIVIVTLQIIWIGNIGELINIPIEWSILFGGIILIFYSARGGIKAITITDILQFIVIAVFVPLVGNSLFYKVGGLRNLLNQVPVNNFNVIQHPSFKDYLVYCIWYIFPAFPLSFPFIQRMLMAKNTKQLVNTYYLSLFFLTSFFLILTLIGLAAIALKNMGDVNMPQQGSRVFIYLVKTYFPIGLKGIVGAGLLAAVMSTADSFLHSAGLLIAHDVIEPICKKKNISINALKLSQYITLILGLLALVIALTYQVLPRVQYGGLDLGKGINIGTEFVAIVFTIPLIAGIMGLKTDAKSFFISFIVTIISFFVSKLFIPNLYFIPFNICMNAISFFGAHFIQNKGFVTVKRQIARLA